MTAPVTPTTVINNVTPELPAIEAEIAAVTKPGVKTTEFWLSVAVFVAATGLLAAGKIDATIWAAATAAPAGAYSLSRAYVKG